MSKQCKAEVQEKGMSFLRTRRCKRKVYKDGYCALHHPDTVAKREERKEDRHTKARQTSRDMFELIKKLQNRIQDLEEENKTIREENFQLKNSRTQF